MRAMEGSIFSPVVLYTWSIVMIVAALVWSFAQGQGSERSRGWLALTTLPGLLVLLAFYSLAIHMHSRLGGWPDFYGTAQLPPELVTHANIAGWVFSFVVLLVLGVPLALALCALVPRLRCGMIYPAFGGAACWLGLLLCGLAPAGFQNWWWD